MQRGYTAADGSVLIRFGRTVVLCTASIETSVPAWREASGGGWVTGEYDMLPAATNTRRQRNRNKVDGRTREIERLIGRSLRGAVDLMALGPNSIYLDCDVLQADGGTRTASITGAYIALADAIRVGAERGLWSADVPLTPVAAVSVGVVAGAVLLDLDYSEDGVAEVDANLVMDANGRWIEVQATGERATYDDDQLVAMLALGRAGIQTLFGIQEQALRMPPPGEVTP